MQDCVVTSHKHTFKNPICEVDVDCTSTKNIKTSFRMVRIFIARQFRRITKTKNTNMEFTSSCTHSLLVIGVIGVRITVYGDHNFFQILTIVAEARRPPDALAIWEVRLCGKTVVRESGERPLRAAVLWSAPATSWPLYDGAILELNATRTPELRTTESSKYSRFRRLCCVWADSIHIVTIVRVSEISSDHAKF